MTLSQKIAAALASLDTLASATFTLGPITEQEGPHRVSLAARSASRLGVELDALDFHADRPQQPERTLDELKAWADRLAARITYLMEPLVVLECDPLGVEVELRSQQATTRQSARNFYEARLDRSGNLRIIRYSFDTTSRTRHAVPFQLSGEVLERLVDDLVDTAG